MSAAKRPTLAELTAEVAMLRTTLTTQADELAALLSRPAAVAPVKSAPGCSEIGHRWRCLARRIVGTYHSELTAWECERCGGRETQQWDWGA